ncbi:MAG: hemolysin family protein [Coprothermobacterota bacterium]|nr:hemolysin family protein [Coprothermobacterota bacterium]
MPDWALYVGPLLILFSLVSLASFSAAESAFLSISKNRLRREMEEKDDPRLRSLLLWREDPQTMLSVLAVGDYISIFAYVALTLWWITRMSLASGWAWLTIVLALILLILAEVGLRLMGVSHPLATLLRFCGFLAVVRILLAPLAALFRIAAKGLFRAGSDLETEEETEVKALAEMREEVEDLPAGEREMISAIFEFREKEVSEVMVPRMDIIALEQSTPLQQALRTMVESGHSRLPIYQEQVDNVTGVLLEKDALRASLEDHPALSAADLARPPFFVPESKRISQLLPEMQRKKTQIALVVDEYGGLEGLVTMEDLLEEIVGEIRDEHDLETEPVHTLAPGSFQIAAGLSLRELEDLTREEIQSEDYDTVGGFLYGLFQHIPTPGEEIDFHRLHFRVEETRGNRILKIRVDLRPEEEQDIGD